MYLHNYKFPNSKLRLDWLTINNKRIMQVIKTNKVVKI